MKVQWWKRWSERRQPPYQPAGAKAEGLPHAGEANNTPQMVAVGTGGRIELMPEHILLFKNHFLGDFINILGLGYGKIQKSIRIEDISSVSIIRPLIFPDFIIFTYPGSPQSTGSVFSDALGGNALIMNLLDNRKFYELKERIHTLRQKQNSN